jgi:hypothetical protein
VIARFISEIAAAFKTCRRLFTTMIHVVFWHKADMLVALHNVRFGG